MSAWLRKRRPSPKGWPIATSEEGRDPSTTLEGESADPDEIGSERGPNT